MTCRKEFLVGNHETAVRVKAHYILTWPERTILVDEDGAGPGGKHAAVITPSAFVVRASTCPEPEQSTEDPGLS